MVSLKLHQLYLSLVAPNKQERIEDAPLVITTTGPKSSCEKGNIFMPSLGFARKELNDPTSQKKSAGKPAIVSRLQGSPLNTFALEQMNAENT